MKTAEEIIKQQDALNILIKKTNFAPYDSTIARQLFRHTNQLMRKRQLNKCYVFSAR